MGLKHNPQVIEQLVELTVNVQTSRTCMTAAELEPETTESGYALPNQLHVAAAGINTLRVRQRMGEILRGLPGSSLVNAPADTDFADPEMAAELEDAFGGGGYTALQRAALLQLAWDQVSSGLDGREAVFELHASGGLEAWRRRLSSWFERYNELANGVHGFLQVDMPPLDLSSLQDAPPRPAACPTQRRDLRRRPERTRGREIAGWAIAKLLTEQENTGSGQCEMGTVITTVEVGDLQGRNFQRLEVEVDTGSTYTALPRELLQALGVPVARTVASRLADGSEKPAQVGYANVRLNGAELITPVIFAEEGEPSLLGAITLEDALLAVDPVNNELIPVAAKRY